MRKDGLETTEPRGDQKPAREPERDASEVRGLRVRTSLRAGRRTDEEQPGNEMSH